jgi:butyryl-CoA dehydrogenase
MALKLSPTQTELCDAAQRFAAAELPDLARTIEAQDVPVSREWRQRYAELGFLGVNLPERYGGLGLGHFEALLVLEEFAKISCAVAFPVFESATGPVRTIVEFASETLKERIVPRVVRGEIVVAVSMSEPGAGTALTDLSTTARIVGDAIILNGQKRWCSGGGHADAYVVYCRLSDAPGAAGIGAVLVEAGTPGLSFGRPEELMGLRGVGSSDIYLDDVRVPVDNLIVPAGGFGKLMHAFSLERCGNATMALATASAALEEAVAYTSDRRQFGKPIVEFQAVQLKLADMALQVEAARALIWSAALNAGDALPDPAESSLAKCFANQIVRDVTSSGMQLLGGYGYSREYAMERRLRDAFAWGIAGGTIDIQKVNIAANLVGRRFNQRA